MGLWSKITGQFIDVIEWRDSTTDTIVYKFPDNDCEIKMGAQLIVRESQAAVFINEGQIADVFTPGRYELTTQNMPILTTLKSWKYGFNSPFKCDVFFVSTKQFTGQKWGTANPVMMRDVEFGMIRVRAFGVYAFRVADPALFLREISGTHDQYETEMISDQLKRQVVSSFSDMLAESKIPAIDMAANYDELGTQAREKLAARFEPLGLTACDLVVENISLPEAVEQAMDKRTSMGVLGDINRYAQYQTAEAIGEAARNPGGLAGAGAGLGVGAGIGQMMGQAMSSMASQPTTPQAPGGKFCPECGAKMPVGAKFCPGCGAQQAPSAPKCPGCGAETAPGAKFCPECGTKL